MPKMDKDAPKSGGPGFGFLSGLAAGLSVLAKPFESGYTPPPMRRNGVADDWKAVGGYMWTAMTSYDEQRRRR